MESISRNSLKSKYSYKYGLVHFQKFLSQSYPEYTVESVINALEEEHLDLYVILDEFTSYLVSEKLELTSQRHIRLYMASVRSYLAYYDIDIIPSKFKRKVKMPRHYREDEEPLDASDIRKILLACNNRRLKPYLLTLGQWGV